jgi:hypothetical protein
MKIQTLSILILFIFSAFLCANYNNTDALIETPELIEGIVGVVNGDIITMRDIGLELIIEGKINKKDVDIYEVLNRIIEDKLIYGEAMKYSSVIKEADLSVEKEYSSLIKMYGNEEKLKEIIFLLGTNLSSLYERLRQKKIIFQYLNTIIYASISYDIASLKGFYRDQVGAAEYDENYFYENLDKIKSEYVRAKSKEYYKNYISALKNVAEIEIDEEMVKFLKK